MKNKTPMRRIDNYYYCRERHLIGDELEWYRVDGMTAVELPRPIVLVTGAFDLLHVGHMRLLFTAREKAGKGSVVCAMNSDESVLDRKGRVIQTWNERAATLAYMPIDVLVEFNNEAELVKLAEYISPDLQVLGDEYTNTRTLACPAAFVRTGSMRTSEIIRRVREYYNV